MWTRRRKRESLRSCLLAGLQWLDNNIMVNYTIQLFFVVLSVLVVLVVLVVVVVREESDEEDEGRSQR